MSSSSRAVCFSSSNACIKQSGGSFLQLQLNPPTISFLSPTPTLLSNYPRCVRSYTVVSLAIDSASAKVLISRILPHTSRKIVFISIAINSFSGVPDSRFQAPNSSNSRHFSTKSVVFLSIAAPLEKSCFSVRFVHTYSLNSLPPPSRRTQQIQVSPQSCAAACRYVQGGGIHFIALKIPTISCVSSPLFPLYLVVRATAKKKKQRSGKICPNIEAIFNS